MTDIERIAASWEVEQRIRLFALRNDVHDFEGLSEMFTPDGSFARPTQPDAVISGRNAILEHFRDRPRRSTFHLVANTVVELADAVRATASSYIVLFVGDDVIRGRFDDRLIRLDGEWLFVERRGSVVGRDR